LRANLDERMTKWTRTRRDPARSYSDEEKLQRKQRMLARLREFVEAGIEAEPDFVEAAKEADPEISKEKLKELITLFRDAVYERQRRDRQSG
jgi:hypothetical protein